MTWSQVVGDSILCLSMIWLALQNSKRITAQQLLIDHLENTHSHYRSATNKTLNRLSKLCEDNKSKLEVQEVVWMKAPLEHTPDLYLLTDRTFETIKDNHKVKGGKIDGVPYELVKDDAELFTRMIELNKQYPCAVKMILRENKEE